jgi:integrase
VQKKFSAVQLERLAKRIGRKDFVYLHKKGAHVGKFFAKVPNGKDEVTGKAKYRFFGPTHDLESLIATVDEHCQIQKDSGIEALPTGKQHAWTVGEWLNWWADNKIRVVRTRTTYDNYKWAIKHYFKSLHAIPLKSLSHKQLLEWRAALLESGHSNGTINYAQTRLKTALSAACAPSMQADTKLTRNPADSLERLPEIEKEHQASDPLDTLKIVEVLGSSYLAALPIVATDLGLRRGEIAGLRWGDIDLERGTVTIRQHVVTTGISPHRKTRIEPGSKTSKGLASWPIQLSPDGVAALQEAQDRLRKHAWNQGRRWRAGQVGRGGYVIPAQPLAPEALVFPARDGDVWEPNAMSQWWVAVAAKAGVHDKSIHSLRHDCATLLIAAGKSLVEVQRQMRHRKPDITAKLYTHAFARSDRDRSVGQAMGAIWKQAREEVTAQAV